MKHFIPISLISILIFTTSCCSSNKIKAVPDDQHNWKLCTICKGTGHVTTLSSKSSSDDVSDNPGNKYSFCLFPFTLFSEFEDDKLTEAKTEKAYSRGYNLNPEQNIDAMKERIQERSIVKKKTRCPLCDGKGWTIGAPEENSPVIIKKKSELTEKDIIIN